MTMADRIAVMNRGRIEQLGPPSELYERPATAFVASFLGASNLLRGRVEDGGTVRLDSGDAVRVPPHALGGRSGVVEVGIRPEKVRLGQAAANGHNKLHGTVRETAYVGVATQYVVATHAGPLSVYVQNDAGGAPLQPDTEVDLSWSPESTFVVDPTEEAEPE